MREKKVKQSTIDRYINFLEMVKSSALPNQTVSLRWIADKGHIAQAAPKALEQLGIIQKEGKYWHWLKGTPTRKMVLEILDHSLTKTKKTVHFPIPELAGIGDTLKEITERLIYLTAQNEAGLKRLKTSVSEPGHILPTIFTEQQQKFEVAKELYKSIFNINFSLNCTPESTSFIENNKHRASLAIAAAEIFVEEFNKPKP